MRHKQIFNPPPHCPSKNCEYHKFFFFFVIQYWNKFFKMALIDRNQFSANIPAPDKMIVVANN